MDLATLLRVGRDALNGGKLDQAVTILGAATATDASSPQAFFLLGLALGRKGSRDAAALCFLRTLQLVPPDAPEPQAQQLRRGAADNLRHQADRVLPTGWLAAVNDAERMDAFAAAAAHLAAAAAHGAAVWCIGGVGTEALLLAEACGRRLEGGAAGQGAQQQQQPVPVVLQAGDQLSFNMGRQLAATNGAEDRLTVVASSGEEDAPPAAAVLLAGACGPAWAQAAAAPRQLARLRAAPGGCAVSPSQVRLVAALAECPDLVALNEVSLEGIASDTGGLGYAAANAALRRSSRPAKVARFAPRLLTRPATVLELDVASWAAACSSSSSSSINNSSSSGSKDDGCGGGGFPPLRAEALVEVALPGRCDCAVWWLEYEMAEGVWLSYAPPAAITGGDRADAAALSWAAADDALRPHAWQHVAYLPAHPGSLSGAGPGQPRVTQGEQMRPGDRVRLTADATATAVCLTVRHAGAGEGPGGEMRAPDTRGPVAAAAAGSPEAGREILPYHLSMLNDSARTVAYAEWIEAAVAGLDPTTGAEGRPPVVLDVGTGTGLLSMLAARAGAGCIVGCEREPVLAAVAQRLVAANGLSDRIQVVQKLSSQLTVATSTPDGANAGAPDLPGPVSLVVHEVFGTDPLSEHVLPTMRHVQERLAAPGCRFVPSRTRVIGAIVACPGLERLQRPVSPTSPAWDLSPLAPLAPRKVELQAADLRGAMRMLTAPHTLLDFDFERQWPLPLQGGQEVDLPLLPRPAALPCGGGEAGGGSGSDAGCWAVDETTAFGLLYWFECDCGDGSEPLTTAPGALSTHLGHWQQSIELVPHGSRAAAALRAAAEGGAASGSVRMAARWGPDRVMFDVLSVRAE